MARRFAGILLATLLLMMPGALVSADQATATSEQKIAQNDTIRSVLERHVGKRVTLRLGSGEELTGTVRVVGDHVVHLSELAGREFFDAVVKLDEIAAVVIRTRSS